MGYWKNVQIEEQQNAPLYEEGEMITWYYEELIGYFGDRTFEELKDEEQLKVKQIADFIANEFTYLPDKETGSEFDYAGSFFMIREKLGLSN